MNTALWIVAGLLAVIYLASGVGKLLVPKETIASWTSSAEWVDDFSAGFVKTIGALEVLAAVGLILPAAIFLVGVAALFITPGLWAKVGDDGIQRKQSWAEFREEGVDTHTGRLTSGEALAQIMTLPVLVIALALFFVVLKSTL